MLSTNFLILLICAACLEQRFSKTESLRYQCTGTDNTLCSMTKYSKQKYEFFPKILFLRIFFLEKINIFFPYLSSKDRGTVSKGTVPPSSKGTVLIFWSKKLRSVLKRVKNQFSVIFSFYGRSRFLKSSEKKNSSQKLRNVLTRIFQFVSSLLLRCLVFRYGRYCTQR